MQLIIQNHLKRAIQSIVSDPSKISQLTIPIEHSRVARHGDFSSNIALNLARLLKTSPMVLAHKIIEQLDTLVEKEKALFQKIEAASPGFINFFIQPNAWPRHLIPILEQQDNYGASDFGQQKRILLEFVSSNPTGPLHIGHGRAAAQGDILARLLKMIGYQVTTEYYINDAGRQMDILALSIWLRYLQNTTHTTFSFPSNAYQGEYVQIIAQALKQQYSLSFTIPTANLTQNLPNKDDKEQFIDALIRRAKNLLGIEKYSQLLQFGLRSILKDIQGDLKDFNVHFDGWFSEKSLIRSKAVNKVIDALTTRGHTYELDGHLWFRATTFGDDKDRVLLRANGQPTYFAVDAAYRLNILKTRGFETMINLLGADHHGYLARIHAVIQALGYHASSIIFSTLQMVSLYRGQQKLALSTRDGGFVTLRALRTEVGNDATRLFFVSRQSNQAIDFDLELAKSESHQNPVYYLQYAYARIASIMRQLEAKGLTWTLKPTLSSLNALTLAEEIQLIKRLIQYPEVLKQAGKQYEPAVLVHYLRELAKGFHAYYNHTPILSQKESLRNPRLSLIKAIQQVLSSGFYLLGIATPTSM